MIQFNYTNQQKWHILCHILVIVEVLNCVIFFMWLVWAAPATVQTRIYISFSLNRIHGCVKTHNQALPKFK